MRTPNAAWHPGFGTRAPAWFILFVSVVCAEAQFSLDWSTFEGSGGTSSGGLYSVSGTLGQPDANTMVGGNYHVQGGFWSILVPVQTAGAPLLSIFLTGTNSVALVWPAPSQGWTLQVNTNSLEMGRWSDVRAGIIDKGPNRILMVDVQTGNRFYRLFKP